MKSIANYLGKHPVEIFCGLLLAAVGVVLTTAGTAEHGQAYYVYVGGVATTFGGILLSWTIGKEVSKDEALHEVRSRLGLVSKTLGQAAGQMSRVVDQCADHSLPAETGFAMVGQQAQLVGAQVSAIQGILGDPFESSDLVTTISELEKLAERLDRNDRGTVEKVAQELRAELHRGGSITSPRVAETATCPNCDNLQTVTIGAYPGDTAVNICRSCEKPFNVHRRSDGSVFSRQRKQLQASESDTTDADEEAENRFLAGACPNCGREVRIKAPSSGGHKFAVCLECAASVIFTATGSSITTDGQFERLTGVVTGRHGSGGSGAKPVVDCDKCGRSLRCVIRKDSTYYSIDNTCRRLIAVSETDFLTWRKDHEPETIIQVVTNGQAVQQP